MPAAFCILLALSAQESPLATLPENASEVVVNADATAVAWVEGAHRVAINGARGEEYDSVRRLTISKVGATVAYAAQKDGKWKVVSDTGKSPEYEEIGDILVDSGGVAFSAKKNKAWVVVCNGFEGPKFDRVDSMALTPDGKRCAYAGRNGKTSALFIGKYRGPEFDEVKGIIFYGEGPRLAYIAVRGNQAWPVEGFLTPESTAIALVRDPGAAKSMVMVGLFDVTEPKTLKEFVQGWLDEGKTPSIEVDSSVPWTEVREVLGHCKAAGCTNVQFGPPNSRRTFETFDSLKALAAAPDRPNTAAIGTQHGVLRVFLGGKQSQDFKSIEGLVAGPNRTLAYRASDGDGWFVVRQFGYGQKVKMFKAIIGPVVSPDGNLVAYGASDGNSWRIVVGNAQSDAYDQVWTPLFALDNSNVTFAARKGREIFRKVLSLK